MEKGGGEAREGGKSLFFSFRRDNSEGIFSLFVAARRRFSKLARKLIRKEWVGLV